MRPPQVDGRGHFIVEAIAGGTYDFTVSLMMSVAPGTRPPRTKQQVVVTDGVVNDVTLILDLGQKPGAP